MEEQLGQEESEEKTTHTGMSCGKVDTGEYCSYCGSKLVFLGDERASSIQNLRTIFKEYFREILDPIFAYIKTLYLLLFRPVKFFQTLYFRDEPIDAIYFPLKSLWEKVSGRERTQYTLHPIAFFTSNVVINIISGAITLSILYIIATSNESNSKVLSLFSTVSGAGLITFLYMGATAFTFDFLTKESNMSPLFKYSFWVYTFSLVWIAWLLGLIILILLLPIVIVFCCGLIVFLGVTQYALSPYIPTYPQP